MRHASIRGILRKTIINFAPFLINAREIKFKKSKQRQNTYKSKTQTAKMNFNKETVLQKSSKHLYSQTLQVPGRCLDPTASLKANKRM